MGGDAKRQRMTEMEKVEKVDKAGSVDSAELRDDLLGTTMGGDAKRQKTTEIEKVEEVDKAGSGSVDFAALRDDLFREVALLCSEVPSTKIAIFVGAPPSSSESDVSVFSFGYPSVDSVLQTFLEDSRSSDLAPAENEKDEDDAEEDDAEGEDDAEEEDGGSSSPRFWWEDCQYESMDAEQLKVAYDRLLRVRDSVFLQLDATSKAEDQGSGNQSEDQGSGNQPEDLLHNDKAQPKP